jgi:transcriptional regulator with XRE-family HTH domain
MTTHRWEDVERDLFPADDEPKVRAVEAQLRDEVRAHRLAEVRRARHLTQQQIADVLGVSKARVSQIEHGQCNRAAIQGLAGYVAALGGQLELVANFGDERIVITGEGPEAISDRIRAESPRTKWPSSGTGPLR